MKPGDIIFFSAIYNDKRARPQIHDMVHVEVFLGGETGEETIGARFFSGKVQIHKSFKFKSTLYRDVKIYFKSLDTWLMGTCKSFCKGHEWLDDTLNWSPTKKSIFHPVIQNQLSRKLLKMKAFRK